MKKLAIDISSRCEFRKTTGFATVQPIAACKT